MTTQISLHKNVLCPSDWRNHSRNKPIYYGDCHWDSLHWFLAWVSIPWVKGIWYCIVQNLNSRYDSMYHVTFYDVLNRVNVGKSIITSHCTTARAEKLWIYMYPLLVGPQILSCSVHLRWNFLDYWPLWESRDVRIVWKDEVSIKDLLEW